MRLYIVSLIIGAAFGFGFYQAVMNHSQFWAIMIALTCGIREADKFYKSEIITAFIRGAK